MPTLFKLRLITIYHRLLPPMGPNARVCMAGMPSLLAALEARGREVEHVSFFITWDSIARADVDRLAAACDPPPPVLGIGCLTLALPLVLQALATWAPAHPQTRIVLGGYGPSDCAAEIMRDFPFVHAVVRGEAEASLPALLEAWERGEDGPLPGVVTRAGDGGPAVRLLDPDALPFPAFDRIGLENFDFMALELNRGCPYACDYCAIGDWTPTMAGREPARVVEEIAYLAARGMPRVVVADETFNAHPRRALEFCRLLIDARLDVEWHAFARVKPLPDELLAAMRDAGCTQLVLGVDTAAPRLLQRHKKGGYTADEAADALWRVVHHIAAPVALLLYGFPDETWEEFAATVRFITRMLAEDPLGRLRLLLMPVVPHPSTAMAGATRLLPRASDHARLFRKGLELFGAMYRRHEWLGSHYRSYETPHYEAKRRVALGLWNVLVEGGSLAAFERAHGAELG